MPTVFNINPPIDGINIDIRSVRCLFWASFLDRSVEVAVDQSHYIQFEGFAQNNANGSSLGSGSVDTGTQTAMDMYRASSVQALMTAAFG